MQRRDASDELLAAYFRANPGYELVVFDRLPEQYQQQWRDMQQDPDFYGVLWPRCAAGLGVKAVCQNTALLFLTLQQPGRLPTYVRAVFGERCVQAVTELVLDGVLEMAWSEAGPFVTGAAAYESLYAPPTHEVGGGRIAQLSYAALQYAQALKLDSSGELALRLYAYNTVPISPAWRRRLPDAAAVQSYLGIDGAGPHRALLDRHWRSQAVAEPDAWLLWRSRRSQAVGRGPRSSYKLYISPMPTAIPEIMPTLLAVLAESAAHSFKIGSAAEGLLRPDKIVAYCSHFEEVAAVAARLQAELGGCAAQGVPFTAAIDPAGLLSWGMDPPASQQLPQWSAGTSWRLWMTSRLAVALLAARTTTATIAPWQFALERLRMEGIDPVTWTPQHTLWQRERV